MKMTGQAIKPSHSSRAFFPIAKLSSLKSPTLAGVYNAMMLVVEPKGADPAEFAGTAPTTSLGATLANAGAVGGAEQRTVNAETSGPGAYTAAGNTRLLVDLPVCGVRRLEVRGSGASDLDFTVSDSGGR